MFIPCKNLVFILNATLIHTKEKTLSVTVYFKNGIKHYFMKFRFIPCKNLVFIANGTLIHTKEKPYQPQSTLKRNKAMFYEV